MSEGPQNPTGAGEGPPEPEWKRRQRLAAIFGEVLPEQTSDERDESPAAGTGEDAGERWLREQVPPHHGS